FMLRCGREHQKGDREFHAAPASRHDPAQLRWPSYRRLRGVLDRQPCRKHDPSCAILAERWSSAARRGGSPQGDRRGESTQRRVTDHGLPWDGPAPVPRYNGLKTEALASRGRRKGVLSGHKTGSGSVINQTCLTALSYSHSMTSAVQSNP